MDKCKQYLEYLIDGRYNNMSPVEKKAYEDKMDPDCRETFNTMKKALDFTRQQQVPDPGKAYWDNYWDTLEDKLDQKPETSKTTVAWPAVFRIAAILFAGIFIGYLLFSSPDVPKEITDISENDIQLAAINRQTASVLEESKVLLLGIVNMDTPVQDGEKIDFSFQKKMSQDLLLQTADLKSQLDKIKNRRMARLINELELILMQIANLEEEFDLPAIEMVREGAENQSLLFKINMERLLMEAGKEHKKEKSGQTKKEI